MKKILKLIYKLVIWLLRLLLIYLGFLFISWYNNFKNDNKNVKKYIIYLNSKDIEHIKIETLLNPTKRKDIFIEKKNNSDTNKVLSWNKNVFSSWIVTTWTNTKNTWDINNTWDKEWDINILEDEIKNDIKTDKDENFWFKTK